jgi:CIC family chloride channel protein
LERRNIHIAIGPQGCLLELVRTDATMRPIDDAIQEDWDLVEQGHYVSAAGTLNTAMTVFARTRAVYLPVVKVGGELRPRKSWDGYTKWMYCAPITRRCLMPPKKSTVN